MKSSFNVSQIREIGQAAKKEEYKSRLAKWTLGYGKWLPRLVSPYVTWAALKIFPGIRPNIISYMMLLICVGAQILLIKGFYIAGGIVLYCSIILDKVDGEVARLRNIYSYRGIFLDFQYHFIYWLCFFSVGLGIYMREGSTYPLFLGITNSLLGAYLRYTILTYEKVMFKINPDIREIVEIEFSDIKAPYFVKLLKFLGQINRQDIVALFLFLFAIVAYGYSPALTIYLWAYLSFLVVHALILLSSSFRREGSRNA